MKNKQVTKELAVTDLLELIQGVNQDIDASKSMSSKFMVRQYQYLKKDYTKQLIQLLQDYDLDVGLQKAA